MERTHRRAVIVVILAAQLVLAAITAVGVVWGYGNLNDKIKEGLPIVHVVPEPAADNPDEDMPVNILVMGEDTRAGEGNDIDGEAGAAGRTPDPDALLGRPGTGVRRQPPARRDGGPSRLPVG